MLLAVPIGRIARGARRPASLRAIFPTVPSPPAATRKSRRSRRILRKSGFFFWTMAAS
jgi:hypothetical protein